MNEKVKSAVFIVMGVSSTGKSTIGESLASHLGGKFIDGDDLHPKSNVMKMAAGLPLDDQDREPWLERIRDAVYSIEKKNEVGVIACSALKKQYRDKIRDGNELVVFLHLHSNKDVIAERMKNRLGHFMPTSLLESQFATLEMPTDDEPYTYTIDVGKAFDLVVDNTLSIAKTILGGTINETVLKVTQAIAERSARTRSEYLARVDYQAKQGVNRSKLACGNLAHSVATCSSSGKDRLLDFTTVNVGIITAYNDMLSAHQPYENYPHIIKTILKQNGHSAQVAGGVPAMCDGVTQGQEGMDISLFSRDLIAQATAVGLSHNAFDATLLLGICDKIAPGQLIGAISFGHLPTMFVPSGPMSTGITNDEKVAIRQKYVAGDIGKDTLQAMECSAYHSAGTCTFYGTANTNQLVFEAMGLMLPGSAFVPVNSPLREALNDLSAHNISKIAANGQDYRPLSVVVNEKSLVNGLVALLASGGSTNHTIHMIAIAKAAGFIINWDDFSELAHVVPQLAKIYPNGPADINEFEKAGGMPTLMARLAERGLIHMDTTPVFGTMHDYFTQPKLVDNKLVFTPVGDTKNPEVIAEIGCEFNPHGGLTVLDGNLGRGVMKTSAVAPENQTVTAPAMVFESQHEVERAYKNGELNHDCIVVVRHNGPAANGMPELHKLMPILGNVMKAGHNVALLTDGRLSGASGKIPSVIHMTPEAKNNGPLAYLKNGDVISITAQTGTLNVLGVDLSTREPFHPDLAQSHMGSGRELFNIFRKEISGAEAGATIF